MGINGSDVRPEAYYQFVNAIRDESITGEEAVRRFADAMGYAYDEANKKWSKIGTQQLSLDDVIYHAGPVSRLNKAETNGRFYGSNRGTGYYGTGHYFVDSATKHELTSNS